jgi:hypothetical protein
MLAAHSPQAILEAKDVIYKVATADFAKQGNYYDLVFTTDYDSAVAAGQQRAELDETAGQQ